MRDVSISLLAAGSFMWASLIALSYLLFHNVQAETPGIPLHSHQRQCACPSLKALELATGVGGPSDDMVVPMLGPAWVHSRCSV